HAALGAGCLRARLLPQVPESARRLREQPLQHRQLGQRRTAVGSSASLERHAMKWVTRERPKIDRIACPWLIARFIEAAPEFLYVPADQVLKVAADTG